MLLNELTENVFNKDSQKINVLYDIGCCFHKHIRKHNSTISSLNRLQFGVSIFHSYAHTPSCQLKYHPRIQEDIGLTDGESLERIWSYLGKFVLNTKHMCPAHRLDILSLAIQHISNRMINDLGNFIYWFCIIIIFYYIKLILLLK